MFSLQSIRNTSVDQDPYGCFISSYGVIMLFKVLSELPVISLLLEYSPFADYLTALGFSRQNHPELVRSGFILF